jgi:polar amino acid transport system substrate-binding protein
MLSPLPLFADQPKIVIASDYRCPYICSEQEKPGYLVELSRKIFEIYGIRVESKIMPWSDALTAAEKGEVDGVMGISDVEGRDLVLPNSPQAYVSINAFARSDMEWYYDSPDSLSGKRLAIVLDYYLNHPPIQQYITDHFLRNPWDFTVESGENAVVDSINSVIDKTSDVYIGYKDVVMRYLDEDHNNRMQVKECGLISEVPVPIYIAFGGENPNASKYLKMLEDGMSSIESIGALKDIKSKYNIK